MNTVETIAARSQQLPAGRQSEVLDFVEFLLAREGLAEADAQWQDFAAAQLAAAYAPSDEIYDQL